MNLRQINQLSFKFKKSLLLKISNAFQPRLLSSVSKLPYNVSMNDQFKHQSDNLLFTFWKPFSFYQDMESTLRPMNQHSRFFSSQNRETSQRSENRFLMNFPFVVWPSLLLTIKNWIFVFFIIKPFYERDFSLSTFSSFSRHALIKVTELISKGEFNALTDFVNENSLKEVKHNYSLMSLKERAQLLTCMDDIFFYFPYQVGIIITDKDDKRTSRVFLEITMCYHIFQGLKDYIEQAKENDWKKPLYLYEDRCSIANYRFIKEVTKGAEDRWMINVLNHFYPAKVGLMPKY